MGKPARIPSSQTPQAVQQFRMQSGAYGGVIPIAFGESRMAGNIIAAWHFKAELVTSALGAFSTGKAGGGPNAFKQYHSSVACILALAEGRPLVAPLLWAPHTGDDVPETTTEIDPDGEEVTVPNVTYVERGVRDPITGEPVG
jgi:hypothetical protein